MERPYHLHETGQAAKVSRLTPAQVVFKFLAS
jgi:hypothetical protein